jgi:hypothetical protein
MGQRLVEGYSVGKGGALRQGETLHVTIDSGTHYTATGSTHEIDEMAASDKVTGSMPLE